MTFLDKLAGGVLRGQGWNRKSPLLKGCLAAAALIAAADPVVSLARRATIDQILDELRSRENFDFDKAVQGFQRSLDRLRGDGTAARAAALASLRRLATDPAAVDLVLRVAQLVALADGAPSREVEAMVVQIAASLGQAPPELDVPRAADAQGGGLPGRVIVIGNEKGGTGKSTTAIHLAVGLAERGLKVACLDLDSRQATLSRFLANRAAARQLQDRDIKVPRCHRLDLMAPVDTAGATPEEQSRFSAALSDLAGHDVVVVDTPGYASRLAPLAYGVADVLLTPINDSFIDVDALADIDVERREVKAPSSFCRLVWQERERRKRAGRAEIDWIVARNRIGHLDTRNSREMAQLLAVLSRRLGFRLQPGFSERVVFRGLFFRGLTLFDLTDEDVPQGSHASLRHARREVGELLESLAPPASGPTAEARVRYPGDRRGSGGRLA